MADTGNDAALVYTLSELNGNTHRVMAEIEAAGRPALITRHGRFIAVITPLKPGEVESQALGEMAREIAAAEKASAPAGGAP